MARVRRVEGRQLTSRDWFGKASAGFLLGYTLALGLTSLFAVFGPGGAGGAMKVQFNMWMMSPVWALILSFCFLFRDSLRAWLWLGAANLVTFGLLYGGRGLIG